MTLGDITVSPYLHPETGANILPWDLRLLTTRLQALASSDLRRAVGGYYDLATEARVVYANLNSDDADGRLLWKARLRDLGVRVANSLVEMGDWEGVQRHLQSLRVGLGTNLDGREEDEMLRGRIALVLLRVGDLEGARRCLGIASDDHSRAKVRQEDKEGDESPEDSDDDSLTPNPSRAHTGSTSTYVEALRPLLALAANKLDDASSQFSTALIPATLAAQNRAVCALYSGRLSEARDLLEGLVADGVASSTLVFNLSTVFELVSERARNLKIGLAERLAQRNEGGHGSGWEVGVADMKLG